MVVTMFLRGIGAALFGGILTAYMGVSAGHAVLMVVGLFLLTIPPPEH